jgi:hypothetical protein
MNSPVTCPPSLLIAQQRQLMSAQEGISAACSRVREQVYGVSEKNHMLYSDTDALS